MSISRRQCLATLGATAAATASGLWPATASAERPPNIVLILSDDQGSTDLGCYGADDLHTPALDRLAAEGLRFTQAYVDAPVCMPSRAALLTGRHFVRSLARDGIRADETTIAEMLRAARYRTGCFGKWHLGHPQEKDALSQGFDQFAGFKQGAIDNWSHYYYYGGANRHALVRGREPWRQDGVFFPHIVTREAKRFIDESADQPFFLYLPLNQPHYPLQAEAPFVEQFQHLSDPRRQQAAVLASMDAQIDQVLQHIDARGLRQDTIVIFLSDHGHSREQRAFGGGGRSAPFSGHKDDLHEGGIRVPMIISAPGRLPAGQVRDQVVSSMDLLPTIAQFAGASMPERPSDGRDLTRVLTDNAASPHGTMHWLHEHQYAVREGHWKLLGDVKKRTNQLFDLTTDPGEKHDRASQHRDVVGYLLERHNEWTRSLQADARINGYGRG